MRGIKLCLTVQTSDQRPNAAPLWRRVLLLYSKQFSLPFKSVYVKVDNKIQAHPSLLTQGLAAT
jgi:hypothetical protein